MPTIVKNTSTTEINFLYQINEKNSFGLKSSVNGKDQVILIKIMGTCEGLAFEQKLNLSQFEAILILVNKFMEAISFKGKKVQSSSAGQESGEYEDEEEDPEDFI